MLGREPLPPPILGMLGREPLPPPILGMLGREPLPPTFGVDGLLPPMFGFVIRPLLLLPLLPEIIVRGVLGVDGAGYVTFGLEFVPDTARGVAGGVGFVVDGIVTFGLEPVAAPVRGGTGGFGFAGNWPPDWVTDRPFAGDEPACRN
jgi:hypothetical protein